MKKMHEKVRISLEKKNQEMVKRVNQERKQLVLESGDWAWVHLQKDRFLTQIKAKLMSRGYGPFQVIKRINDNAYKIDLPLEHQVHNNFNMYDFSLVNMIKYDNP